MLSYTQSATFEPAIHRTTNRGANCHNEKGQRTVSHLSTDLTSWSKILRLFMAAKPGWVTKYLKTWVLVWAPPWSSFATSWPQVPKIWALGLLIQKTARQHIIMNEKCVKLGLKRPTGRYLTSHSLFNAKVIFQQIFMEHFLDSGNVAKSKTHQIPALMAHTF